MVQRCCMLWETLAPASSRQSLPGKHEGRRSPVAPLPRGHAEHGKARALERIALRDCRVRESLFSLPPAMHAVTYAVLRGA